ncbi:MAG: Crp/Fnr family transcriptional regulator [Acidobacteria bacterium]|nr:MAG: Crp/Fnr family transcriptional regulator [Acidobacteriota bacterium]
MLTDADRRAVARHPLFVRLEPRDRERLLEASSARIYRRGELLFAAGDSAHAFFVALSGWVVLYRLSAQGERVVLRVVRRPESFAEAAALGLASYPAWGEAASEARVLAVPGTAYRRLLLASPETGLQVIAELSRKLAHLVRELEQRQARTTTERVARFLAEAAADGEGPALVLPVEKSLLAARLGMTPESFSRALARLKREGAIRERSGRIELLDRDRLRVAGGCR